MKRQFAPLLILFLVAACGEEGGVQPADVQAGSGGSGGAPSDQGAQAGGGGQGAGGGSGGEGGGGEGGSDGEGGGGGEGGSGGAGGYSPENDNTFRPEERPFSDELLEKLKTKPGFTISVFARGADNARMMELAPGGGVYVTRPTTGDVLLLRDTDGNGAADESTKVFTGGPGFETLHGIALDAERDTMYLATATSLYAAPIDGDGRLGDASTLITDLPDGGQHGKRTMRFTPDGTSLLFSVGSSCNACAETNPEHAALLLIDPSLGPQTQQDRTVFAKGLRNTIGFDWYPGTDELWGMDHGSDQRGNVVPPEELNRLVEGNNYGWPYVYSSGPGERGLDPIMDDPPDTTKQEYAAATEPAVLIYDAHSAPIDFRFYTGDQFPAEYKNDAFVAMRGSWNRYPPVGYKVVRVLFDDATHTPTGFEDFITGWLIEDGRATFGRPAGLLQMPDGSLLVSDDTSGIIYRVSYTGQ
ncbi:PQQ-dependent sugar dehydrogenase [Sorangium sp. So ce394]|uniref:PQQ-dependent sugar dehydrogenase n=1 Tax=Sorangium sp. So ce394 TaxID=3133310 RepID=UPI003F5C1A9E